MSFKDHFSGHAADYAKYRPTYPPELFAYLASIAPDRDSAWDCATGNGQAARALAPFFRHVIATDASRTQIAQAPLDPRIQYFVAPADQTPIPAGSIALVTVAQAVHWFDLPKFYAEVRRVTRPGGVLACWCYTLLSVAPPIDAVLFRLYEEILGTYWPPERRLTDEKYQTIPFPFDELSSPPFEMHQTWTLDQLAGYLNTWSSVKKYQLDHGENPLELIWDELTALWGDPQQALPINWPLHMRVGRVDSKP
jgi:SAM-dependent methyltransferase